MSEGASARGRRGRRGGTHNAIYLSSHEQNRALYHCNTCAKDISDNVRIKCADCPDFDQCVECFSVGVETHAHKNSHSYRVMDNLSFPIFHPEWGSDEELLLLEAVDIYGLGNWAAVAEHVGTKSKQACQHHYFQIYIEPESCPLPTPAPEMVGVDVQQLAAIAKSNCGRKRMRLDPAALQQQQQQSLQQQQQQPQQQHQQHQQQQHKQQQEQQHPDIPVQDVKQPLQANAQPTAAAAGADQHIPLLGNAGTQQQHVPDDGADAELMVKQEQEPMQHGDIGQHKQQTQKAVHVRGKGAMRQEAADTPGAPVSKQQHEQQQEVEQQQHQQHPEQAQKHLPSSSGGSAAAAPVHAAAASPAMAEAVATNAAAASTATGGTSGTVVSQGTAPLAKRLTAAAGTAAAGAASGGAAAAAEHPRVRGSGPQLDMMTGWHAKRFEFEPEWDNDAELSVADLEFKEDDPPEEVAGKLRVLEIYNKRLDERARRQTFILEHGLLNVRRMQGLEKRRLAGERERYAQMRVFARYQPPGSHEGFVEGLLVENRLRMRIAELQAHRAAGRRTMVEVEEAELEAGSKKKGNSKSQVLPDEMAGSSTNLGGYCSTASALNVWRQRRGLALDISGLPGLEHLSSREAELCANARLLPAHYLSLKDVMMRDAEVHGHISRIDARSFFRLDPSRSARVWELLCASGWLRGNAPEEAEDRRRGGRGAAAARKLTEVAAAAAVTPNTAANAAAEQAMPAGNGGEAAA